MVSAASIIEHREA